MVEQLTLNTLFSRATGWLRQVLRPFASFWRVLAVVAVLLSLGLAAASTRYDYRRNGELYWRIDRWTGTVEYYSYFEREWTPLLP
jgi:hypothetical protein